VSSEQKAKAEARAARFGLPTKASKQKEAEKLDERAKRFKGEQKKPISAEQQAKIDARKARFAAPPMSAEEEAKRAARAARFA
jgi:hypothetical protein